VGALHVTFQSRAAFGPQSEVYERLVETSDLTVHVYAPEDWTSADPEPEWTPPTGGINWHHGDTEELRETWLVAYDGGTDDTQKCTLVAFEEREDEYRGFWTYDPGLVDEIIDYLRWTYR
jgi:DICT domain-containing protein